MIFVPIIKPVGGDCNISCGYCYFLKSIIKVQKDIIMSDEILLQLINQVCSNQKKAEFIWHGGEPLLTGIDFYKKAIEYQLSWIEKGLTVYNSIQTNSTLITDEWINFFKNNNFSVSVSIDGPRKFHDQVRIDKNGHGTFKRVLEKIKDLQKMSLLSGIICCISKINCNHPKEIFSFFVEHEIRDIKFLQVQGRNEKGDLLPYSIDPIEFANFMLGILDCWLELDDETIKIVEIDSIIKAMLGKEVNDCMFMGECYKYFTVYPDGTIYGCDSLPKIEQYSFGHISEKIDKISKSKTFKSFCQRLKDVQWKCCNCKWFKICNGGCLQDYYPDIFNQKSKNLFCPGLKKIYKKIDHVLKKYDLLPN